MKASVISEVVSQDLQSAQIVVDLPDGKRVTTTGFVVREDSKGRPMIVLKTGKPVAARKELFLDDVSGKAIAAGF